MALFWKWTFPLYKSIKNEWMDRIRMCRNTIWQIHEINHILPLFFLLCTFALCIKTHINNTKNKMIFEMVLLKRRKKNRFCSCFVLFCFDYICILSRTVVLFVFDCCSCFSCLCVYVFGFLLMSFTYISWTRSSLIRFALCIHIKIDTKCVFIIITLGIKIAY